MSAHHHHPSYKLTVKVTVQKPRQINEDKGFNLQSNAAQSPSALLRYSDFIPHDTTVSKGYPMIIDCGTAVEKCV